MKKYFIIAAAALVSLCACTKNEVAQPENQKEVSFQVANYLTQTKANVAFEGNSFGVFAWYDSEAADGKNQAFMVNQTIEKVRQNGNEATVSSTEWKPAGKTYYWPKTGDVDFFAYAPEAATPWIACDDANHKLSAPRTVIAGNEDLLYSSMAMNYSANVDPATYNKISGVAAGVPILFHHALAKLTVNFAASEVAKNGNIWDITVNTAEFVKVYNAGSLTMDMNAEADGLVEWKLPENAIWSASTGDSANLVAASGLKLDKSFKADKVNNLTVLPQDLAGMKFHINYTIKVSNDGGKTWYSNETVDREYPVTTAFSAAGNYWKMNTKITYNVTIAPNSSDEVVFDPAVVDWESVSGSAEIGS